MTTALLTKPSGPERREADSSATATLAPWNTVWLRDEVVAFIDFDHAHPGSPLDDIVYSLEYGAPFRDDATCLAFMRYPVPPDRRRRIEVFCDAYGMSAPDVLANLVADRQLRDLQLVADLAGRGLNRRPHGSATATSTRSDSALPGPCRPESDPALKGGRLGSGSLEGIGLRDARAAHPIDRGRSAAGREAIPANDGGVPDGPQSGSIGASVGAHGGRPRSRLTGSC